MQRLLLIVLPLLLIVGCKKKSHREYYENGQIELEGTFKDDKMDGLWTSWYENGQKRYESTKKDGESIGLYTEWFENGQKKMEGSYKDGKKDGLWTIWYENGQKESELTYKDGKPNGLGIVWHENGQKHLEQNYKEGKIFSGKKLNEDGSIKAVVYGDKPEPINFEEMLNEFDGVYYTKDTNKPYSGPVFSLDRKGRKKVDGTLYEGDWMVKSDYDYSGSGDYVTTTINGNEKNTKIKTELKNGRKIREEYFHTITNAGLSVIEWYENGQVSYKQTSNPKTEDVSRTYWYENGQKKFERKWNKNTNASSIKEWNEDGSMKK